MIAGLLAPLYRFQDSTITMSRTRVKICGVRRVEDARMVAEAGADALGLVFYPPSPRAVDPDTAAAICRVTAPLMTVVALFVDPEVDAVRSLLRACAIDVLQFHGSESAAFCEQFERPYIKALRMRPGLDVAAELEAHPRARAFLFDAWSPDLPGGTGHSFDWGRLPTVDRPWMLAGGLTAANVGEAIARLAPPAVDVSGGVERAPGDKDEARVQQFIAAVRAADENKHEDAA